MVGCSLCTCKCVKEKRKGEIRTRLLASSHWAGHGVARRWARAHDVHVNSLTKSGPKPRRTMAFFCHLFFAMSPCLIHFNRDKPSLLRDIVTLGGSSL
jgi:hypothetical protein